MASRRAGLGGVRYVDLYPGLDLEISSEGGEWSWRMVAKQGDTQSAARSLGSVRLRVSGAEKLSLAQGELRAQTVIGDVALPLVAVTGAGEGAFSPTLSADGSVTNPYTVAVPPTLHAADASSVLLYATYLGGSNNDEGYGVAVDGSGNAYVAGSTFSSDFPRTPGAFDRALGGAEDAFVAKLSLPTPSRIYLPVVYH